ncbi:MAG: tripartite tricarboxylate transporter substrate-binding protein [Burkholderiales bacterium]
MKCTVIALVGAATFAAANPAHAQSWPTKPLRILVASTAGSSIDVPVRIIGERLRDRLGQPVIVENRPAIAGTAAAAEVAKAAPDGYTFVMGFNGPFANAPHLYSRLTYDPVKDLAPVIKMGSSPFVLGVPVALGVNSVNEWLELLRKQPGKLNYSSLGNGSGTHLTMELLKTEQKVFIVHIPYVGGPAAAQAVATGEVQGAFLPPAVFAPHVAAGRVKLLAVSTAARFALLPNVPTMIEAGVKGFDSEAWSGIMGPAGTPRAILDRLNREINEVLKSSDVQASLAKAQTPVVGGTVDQFGALVASETKRWGPVIKYTGLKLD